MPAKKKNKNNNPQAARQNGFSDVELDFIHYMRAKFNPLFNFIEQKPDSILVGDKSFDKRTDLDLLSELSWYKNQLFDLPVDAVSAKDENDLEVVTKMLTSYRSKKFKNNPVEWVADDFKTHEPVIDPLDKDINPETLSTGRCQLIKFTDKLQTTPVLWVKTKGMLVADQVVLPVKPDVLYKIQNDNGLLEVYEVSLRDGNETELYRFGKDSSSVAWLVSFPHIKVRYVEQESIADCYNSTASNTTQAGATNSTIAGSDKQMLFASRGLRGIGSSATEVKEANSYAAGAAAMTMFGLFAAAFGYGVMKAGAYLMGSKTATTAQALAVTGETSAIDAEFRRRFEAQANNTKPESKSGKIKRRPFTG